MHVIGRARTRALATRAFACCGRRDSCAAAAGPAPPPPPGGSRAAPAASDPRRRTEPPARRDGAEIADKAECLSRYEEAQVARRERRLLASRAALRICSGAACPAAIRADCVDWLDQVSHSLPSVVVTARARGADVAGREGVHRRQAGGRAADAGSRWRSIRGCTSSASSHRPGRSIEREVLASEGVKDRHIDVEFAPPLPTAAQLAARAEPPSRSAWSARTTCSAASRWPGSPPSATSAAPASTTRINMKTTCKPYCSASTTSTRCGRSW